jgi:hypothetical protein
VLRSLTIYCFLNLLLGFCWVSFVDCLHFLVFSGSAKRGFGAMGMGMNIASMGIASITDGKTPVILPSPVSSAADAQVSGTGKNDTECAVTSLSFCSRNLPNGTFGV